MTEVSVRGAGRARSGATDTTMLIWKTIAANPGITRPDIWEQVEHSIPEGYAMRRFPKLCADDSPHSFQLARRELLCQTLHSFRRYGNVTSEGRGQDRRYTAMRPPRYRGNPDVVDETGTKAAEHMAVADALRTVEKMLTRAKPDARGTVLSVRRKEYEALALVVKTLRAKGSTSG